MSWSDCSNSEIIFFKNIYLFIYLAVLGLSCGVWDFPGGPVVKNSPWNARDVGLILGLKTNITPAKE